MVNINSPSPIFKVDNPTVKVDKSVSTSHTDQVLDLTNSTKTLKNELNKTGTNFKFIQVKGTDGKNTLLSVEGLSTDERQELISDLKTGILDGDKKVSKQFSHVEFAELTQGHDFSLQIKGKRVPGASTGEIKTYDIHKDLGTQTFVQETASEASSHIAPLSTADAVIAKSNENPDDKMWTLMNGGLGTEENNNFKNGIILTHGEPFIRESGSTQENGKAKLTSMSMSDYQAMIVSDFNFNGAMSKFANVEDFTESLSAAYPEKAVEMGKDNFNALAENIYSYAKTGHDAGTPPKTNIAEMQGMLYVLDPEIGEASDTNTKMQDGRTEIVDGKTTTRDIKTFTPPGWSGPPLFQGDGYHGRATILTTRFILEKPQKVEKPPESFSLSVDMDVSLPFKMDPEAYTTVSGDVTGSMSGNLIDIERKRNEIQTVVGYEVPLQIFLNNSTQVTRAGREGQELNVTPGNSISSLRTSGSSTRRALDGRNSELSDNTQRESPFNAAISSIENIDPTISGGDQYNKIDVVILCDEPEKDPLMLEQLIQAADIPDKEVNVRFVNPKTGQEVTLAQIKQEYCNKDGSVNRDKLLNKTVTSNSVKYDQQEDAFVFDFNRIAPGFGTVSGHQRNATSAANPAYLNR